MSRALEVDLVDAALHGELERVRELLARGVSANAARDGSTALSLAVSRRDLDMVQLLLEHGADARQRQRSMGTLLHAAAFERRHQAPALIRLLVRHGADLEARNDLGVTPLMTAVEYVARHRAAELRGRIFVDEGATAGSDRPDPWLDTPATTAVSPPPHPDDAWAPPLANVETLLALGADPDARDPLGGSVVSIALGQDADELAEWLVARGADERPLASARLRRAAGQGDEAMVERQLAAGADPNARSVGSWTPLSAAAAKGHLGIARRLLTAGADPRLADGESRFGDHFPLLHAVYGNHLEVARALLAAGANPRQRGFGRQRVLDFAKRGQRERPGEDWAPMLALLREAMAGGPPTVVLGKLGARPPVLDAVDAAAPALARLRWREARLDAVHVLESASAVKPAADWDAIAAAAAAHGYAAVVSGWSLDDREPELAAAQATLAAVDAETGRRWLAAEVAEWRSAETGAGVGAVPPDEVSRLAKAPIVRKGDRWKPGVSRGRLVLASCSPEAVVALYEMATEDLEPALFASVLAAWREDVGAALAGFDGARADLRLAAPLADDAEVRRRALELLVFDVDLGDSVRGLLAMAASRQWSFWWD